MILYQNFNHIKFCICLAVTEADARLERFSSECGGRSVRGAENRPSGSIKPLNSRGNRSSRLIAGHQLEGVKGDIQISACANLACPLLYITRHAPTEPLTPTYDTRVEPLDGETDGAAWTLIPG